MYVNRPIDYYTLLTMKNVYIRRCKERGLCRNQTDCLRAEEFFNKKAKELGWIEKI